MRRERSAAEKSRFRPRVWLALATLNGVVLIPAPALAQFGPSPSYGTATAFTAQTNPQAVTTADFNNDGALDLVAVNAGSDSVTVLLGNGLGGFTAAVGSPFSVGVVGALPVDVAAANVNGDANVDIVTANLGTSNVSVLLGNGSGGFTAATGSPFLAGTDCHGVAIGDVTGDSVADLVVANDLSFNVSVLAGNGSGTFAAPVNYAVGTNPRGITLAHLNGDGRLDVLVANVGTDNLSVLLGNASGLLDAAVNYATGDGARNVATGDLSGDGNIDVVVVNRLAGTVSVLLGNGNGTVQAAVNYPAGAEALGLVVADFNVDGKLDVGVSNLVAAGTVTLLNGDGLGALQAPGTAVPAGANPFDVGSGDFSGDGKVDLAVANFTTATASVLLNTLVLQADLSVTKTDGQASETPGTTVSYTMTVSNAGPNVLTRLTLTDPVPGVLLSPVFTPGTGSYNSTNGAWTGIRLAPGGSLTMTLAGTISAAATGNLVNTVAVATTAPDTDPDTTNNTATDTDALIPSADLAIVKTGPASVTPGQTITYTIAVTNNGPSNAAGASVADVPPAALAFVDNTGACTTLFPCTLGSFTVGQTRTITSRFTLDAGFAGASVSNTASLTPTTADPVPANNSSTATSTVVTQTADLAVTKTGPATVVPGQNLTYTITVRNNGPDGATGVAVADTLPSGLTLVSITGDCTSSAFPCALGALASGASRTFQATVKVDSGYSGASPIVNTATVSATSPADVVPGNNSASASTTVLAASADLSITKTGPATVAAGADIQYTITVTNAGPSDAAGVQVTDPTPTDLTFTSNAGDCTTAFTCALGVVPAGATRTITATFAVPDGYAGPDPIGNAASVASSTADPDATDNSATASTDLIGGVAFHTLAPCRVLDTRDPAGVVGGPALAPGPARTFPIAGTCGVPATARAVSINVTVTGPTDPGDLRIYPAATTPPLASAINYSSGQTRANNAVVQLGTGGGLDVLCDQAAGTVHFILDVNGYFE